jgi:hypothetical protein
MNNLFKRTCIFFINNSFHYIIIRICYKIMVLSLGIFLFPVSIFLVLMNYRILKIDTGRIGHFSIEPDIILKGQRLGFLKKYKYIMIIQDKKKLISI